MQYIAVSVEKRLNFNKLMKVKYRFLSLFPALFIMIGIFCFSSQPAVESSQLSGGIVENLFQVIEKLFHLQLSAADRILRLDTFETIIRKAAHMSEYGLLAVAVAYSAHIYGQRRGKLLLWSECICVMYAFTDEFHQLFIPGRSGQITDVIIDGIGAFIGFYIFYIGVRHMSPFIFKVK